MKEENTDVLIIGAGPSGTVAAAMVQKSGLRVKIVEKQRFPRFVIGESLLPKCMEHLEEAGFMEVLERQDFQKKHGAQFIRGKDTCLFDFGDQYTDSWKWTWQVPRADFDKVLADEVASRGVEIDYETSVIGIEFDENDHSSITSVVDKEGKERHIHARYVIDASGYGRVLPRLLNLEKKSGMNLRMALFSHFKDEKRPAGSGGSQITFIIHRVDLWVWIIPFSNGITSVGFVGNPDFFMEYQSIEDQEERLRKMVNDVPQMAERFKGAELVMDVKSMKAFAVSSEKLYDKGYVITGNSSEFIDPVFSSGVTFATQSGLIAGKLVGRSLRGEVVDWEKEYAEMIHQGVETFRTYVKHWYDGSLQDIFFYTSSIVNPTLKQQLCSVLAGYVWDDSNPFVKKHERAVKSLAKVVKIYE